MLSFQFVIYTPCFSVNLLLLTKKNTKLRITHYALRIICRTFAEDLAALDIMGTSPFALVGKIFTSDKTDKI